MSEEFSCLLLNCKHCCCHSRAVWSFKELLPTTAVQASNQSLPTTLLDAPKILKNCFLGRHQACNASKHLVYKDFVMRTRSRTHQNPVLQIPRLSILIGHNKHKLQVLPPKANGISGSGIAPWVILNKIFQTQDNKVS